MTFVTYMHARKSDGKIFYIGKGLPRRPTSTHGRSEHWKRVVAKHGFDVHICASWPSEEEAFAHERLLVSVMRDMGQPLVNQTDGGEGVAGSRWTEARRDRHAQWVLENPEIRAATSERAAAMMSDPDHKMAMASAVAEHFAVEGNRNAVGERMRAYWTQPENKLRIAEATKSRMAIRDSRLRISTRNGGRTFIHIESGVIYDMQSEASAALGICQSAISNVLRGVKASVRGATFKYIEKAENQ